MIKLISSFLLALFLSTLLVVIVGPKQARADGTFCNVERRDFYRGWREDWPAQCGRKPDTQYLNGLKRDCAATRARIEYDIKTGGVGSWVANWGIYGEETCLALEFGNAL